MKKINKSLLLLFIPLLSGLMAGCNKENITPENPQFIADFIEKASQSYTLSSLTTQKILRTDGSELVTNEIKLSIKMMSGEEKRFSQAYEITSFGETYSAKQEGVRDENGYLCKEILNYKNEVTLLPIVEEGSKIVYDSEFLNPFLLIESKDLTKKSDGIYSLNPDKQLLFNLRLQGEKDYIKDFTFTFEDEEFKSINILYEDFESRALDKNSDKYIKTNVQTSTKVLLKDIGSTTIEGIKPKASRNKEQEAKLKKALEELGTNYTIIMNEHDRDNQPNNEYDSPWYFNGSDKVYHQQSFKDTTGRYDLYYKADPETFGDNLLRLYTKNDDTGVWEYNKPTYPSSYNTNPKPYEHFVPKTQGIAPEIFNFDAEKNTFICDTPEVIGYLGNSLLPGCYSIKYFTKGQGDKCEIQLTSDGKIKQITVGYWYLDPQGYEIYTDFDMKFLNINKTTIPTWVEE